MGMPSSRGSTADSDLSAQETNSSTTSLVRETLYCMHWWNKCCLCLIAGGGDRARLSLSMSFMRMSVDTGNSSMYIHVHVRACCCLCVLVAVLSALGILFFISRPCSEFGVICASFKCN
jgi:hypothetical protein